MSKAPTTITAASTDKLVIAATLQESEGSMGGHVLQNGVLGYCMHEEQGTHSPTSLFQNSDFKHCPELVSACIPLIIVTVTSVIQQRARAITGSIELYVCVYIEIPQRFQKIKSHNWVSSKSRACEWPTPNFQPCFNSVHTHALGLTHL